MSTKQKKQQLPKWFTGLLYEEGGEVQNPFSGECYTLTGPELSMYDFIMGCNYMFEMAPNTVTQKRIDEFHKALNWFRKNNSEAYMVLLD